jgi:hypothetical protein
MGSRVGLNAFYVCGMILMLVSSDSHSLKLSYAPQIDGRVINTGGEEGTMPELILHGCTPEPLMSYLKALGILRLVAEQADPEARGAWRAGGVYAFDPA